MDHLVYAAPDLEAAVARLSATLGIRAVEGGRHAVEGTRNALIALGPASYLEIVGPDPELPAPAGPRWFGIDAIDAPRLVAWAAHGEHLEEIVHGASLAGVALGPVRRGSRLRPDGVVLSWSFTDPHTVVDDGIVPFFIDWGGSPHPARTAAPGCLLTDLRAEHPEPERVRQALRALGLALPVTPGPKPALVALLESPKGTVEVR